jgi:Kdo2-lipid IVA lauroyltransferase/acyltransferase
MKKVRYILEFLPVAILHIFLKVIGLNLSRIVCKNIAVFIGTKTPVSKTATANIKLIYGFEDRELLKKMWANLGYVAAEFVHINRLSAKDIEFVGMQELLARTRPAIMVGGHLGNWELYMLSNKFYPLNATGVFREARNPYFNWYMKWVRGSIAKSFVSRENGLKEFIRQMKTGGVIGIATDQRQTNGKLLDFMGHPAYTATSAAELAIKYNADIYPLQVIRIGVGKFKFIAHHPLDKTGLDAEALTLATNKKLEEFIRQNPEQWFWLHNRWRI